MVGDEERTLIGCRGGDHARHRTTRLHERRGNRSARLHGGRRRGSAHAARRAGTGVPLRTLTAAQAATLDALAQTLVPGARQAGISHFVDQQISIPAEEALLEARILNVRPPYANFYRAALGAVDRASQALNNGRPFAELGEAEQRSFVDNMRQNKVEGWQGPGGPFVYLVLRSDAVDVVYGTMEG